MRWFYRGVFHLVWSMIASQDKKKFKKNNHREELQVLERSFMNDDKKQHKMNVVLPKEVKEKNPVFIDIHGGGWMYGDKDLNLDYGKYMADKGFVVFLPSYSLIFEAKIDQIEQELFAALSYIKEHEQEYHLDLDNVFLSGDSAGGHLCLLTLAINQSEELQKIYKVKPVDVKVKKLYLCHPVPFVKTMPFAPKTPFLDRGARDCFLSMLTGKDYKKESNILINNCDLKDFSQYMKELPKAIVSSSYGDVSFREQSEATYKLLKDKGFDVSYKCIEDDKFMHVENVSLPDLEKSDKLNKEIVDFFLEK